MVKYATAINCIDGRTQVPVIEYIKRSDNIDQVDLVTFPGVVKLISENDNQDSIEQVKKSIEVSLREHDPAIITIAGHNNCCSNGVDDEQQVDQIYKAVEVLHTWYPSKQIVGLWVDRVGIAHQVI